MSLLQALRSAQTLASMVLASFVLVLSVAAVSPVLHPQGLAMVCSSGGAMKLVEVEGNAATTTTQLSCPLCLVPGALPPAPKAVWFGRVAVATTVTPWTSAHVARLLGAALPARGPPDLFNASA